MQEDDKEMEHLMRSNFGMTFGHLSQPFIILFLPPLFSHSPPLYFYHCVTFECINWIKQVCGAPSWMPRPVSRGVSRQAKNAEPAASHAH